MKIDDTSARVVCVNWQGNLQNFTAGVVKASAWLVDGFFTYLLEKLTNILL